ncbi:CutA1 divalent ion tolerance protein [Natrialba chahannaoensis JCM 10990]|uniref:CutA1 divalent ion tolerance protein n=1 Tax=Natrialba chahannaoensis JCM 10990 TaxID=1227492 RepID=M0AM98_9EURY|nr:divalent-cation tolerance protein CutA [Natrialba chahannaoensis]ELY99017.1 CutA1 divalent ion tolerance protein [Natrialba chahannaoensis JCM 10990]
MPTVYITAPPDAADALAETLIDEQLAACVNRLSTTSTYRWEGKIHHDDEAVLFAKTTDDAYDDLVDRVQQEHPYDVPCIERFDEADVLESFAQWRAESVQE